MPGRILLSDQVLLPERLAEELGGPEFGAIVTFAGVVRELEGDTRLQAIDYEAYASMAEKKLRELLAEAESLWPGYQAVVAHRTGVVPVGEIAVWIGVATAHRAAAFDTARWLIDELKARVPIWKRDHLAALDTDPTVE